VSRLSCRHGAAVSAAFHGAVRGALRSALWRAIFFYTVFAALPLRHDAYAFAMPDALQRQLDMRVDAALRRHARVVTRHILALRRAAYAVIGAAAILSEEARYER